MKQRAVLHKLGGATYANRKPYWQELLFDDVPIMYPEYGFRGLIKYIKGLQYVTKSPLAATNPDFMNTALTLMFRCIYCLVAMIVIAALSLRRNGSISRCAV